MVISLSKTGRMVPQRLRVREVLVRVEYHGQVWFVRKPVEVDEFSPVPRYRVEEITHQ